MDGSTAHRQKQTEGDPRSLLFRGQVPYLLRLLKDLDPPSSGSRAFETEQPGRLRTHGIYEIRRGVIFQLPVSPHDSEKDNAGLDSRTRWNVRAIRLASRGGVRPQLYQPATYRLHSLRSPKPQRCCRSR
jgi:hypothetical protein